ncbi:MAG: hypothetical protein GZ087_13665 [Flavobacterium sp.]|nr:hypothetical protein [Flavobacterium sp.]
MIYLFGIFSTFAVPHPPAPTGKKPPPPPGLPIDDNLFILSIIAVLFGVYIIYKYQLKTKTPT